MAGQLNVGDLFPEYKVRGCANAYSSSGVVIFYRGGWCPYCNRQLADFESFMEEFKKEDVDVVALSVDAFAKAKETVDKLKLSFPVAYGLEAPRDAEKIDAFWDAQRKIIQPANFVLDSEKTVVDASYSIGPIGRITAADALSHIQFFKRRKAQQS